MIRILTSLVALLTIASAQAQESNTAPHEIPRLVIGITIDQLRGDYLKLFQKSFSEKGFKRIFKEGLVYQNLKFDFPNIDAVSALATIYTGANPFYNGISGVNKYLPDEHLTVSSLDDDNYLGNYTQDKLSPLGLKTSTITDELKSAAHGNCLVYSFSPNAEEALVSAGHTANTAYWIDNLNGKWATTSYYKNLSSIIDKINDNDSTTDLKSRTIWEPMTDNYSYLSFPYHYGDQTFMHNFAKENDYTLFKQTPFVNEYIKNTVCKMLDDENVGSHMTTDFLALTLYAGNYPNSGEYSAEIQDTYIRLDKQLGELLEVIDKKVGLKNTLIFITSTGYYKDDSGLLPNENQEQNQFDYNLGAFYIDRCQALLNMYLMATYNDDCQFVDGFHDGQIYLNRKLIEQKNIPLQEIQSKAADFVAQFKGVQEVYTSYQILRGQWNPIMQYYRNGFIKNNSGDLFVELQPGQTVYNQQDSSFKPFKVRNNSVICPLIFLGNNIKPAKIKRAVDATEIAPTISYIMRIRAPGAAKAAILPELY